MWTAKFKNGDVLEQIKDDKKTPFRQVLDRGEDLESFAVALGDKAYSVSLVDGVFTVTKNGVSTKFYLLDRGCYDPLKLKYRIIYFERCIQFLTPQHSFGGILFTAIGWQTTQDDVNIKRILRIYPDGSLEILAA